MSFTEDERRREDKRPGRGERGERGRARWSLPALGLACAALALTGCSGLEERAPLEAPPAGIVAKALGVSHVAIDYKPTDPKKIWPGRYSPEVSGREIEARIGALLVERKDADVKAVPLPNYNGSGLLNLLDADIRGAKALGADRLLRVSIEDATIKYEGQRNVIPLKIFFTVFFFPFDVPNYFIASDKFALVIRAKWQLIDTTSGQTLAEGTSSGRQGSHEGDFSRGWYFVGYLRVPQCLDAESWNDIAQGVVPGAQDAVAEAVVVDVEKALAAFKP